MANESNIKEIIALQEYSDKYISLYEGEVRNINIQLANRLIEQGIVAEHDETGSDESSSSGGVFTISDLPEMIQISSTEIDGNSVEACWNDSLHFALVTHATQSSSYIIMNCTSKTVGNDNNGSMTVYTGKNPNSNDEMTLILSISNTNIKRIIITIGLDTKTFYYNDSTSNYICETVN